MTLSKVIVFLSKRKIYNSNKSFVHIDQFMKYVSVRYFLDISKYLGCDRLPQIIYLLT